MESIIVMMGKYKISNNSSELVCMGLGSCVGVVLYDSTRKVGALAHIVLPKQSEGKKGGSHGKYADAAIQSMVRKMESLGAEKKQIRAKLFGGANMFPNVAGSQILRIGERNVQAVREELSNHEIKIVSEDVGGHGGRTIYFDVHTGKVKVKNIRGEAKYY